MSRISRESLVAVVAALFLAAVAAAGAARDAVWLGQPAAASAWGSSAGGFDYGSITTEWEANPDDDDDDDSPWGSRKGKSLDFGSIKTDWQPTSSAPWGVNGAKLNAGSFETDWDSSGAPWGYVAEVEVGPGSSAVYDRDLEVGSVGPDVLALQRFLNGAGFPVATEGPGSRGQETDIFGERTRAALAAFQATNGIAPAEGYYGPRTRAMIKAGPAGAGE